MNSCRTALLIRCSREEAATVRAQAHAERRTISGCILNILERSLWMEEQYSRGMTRSFLENQAREFRLMHRIYDRTTMLLRCSVQEAERIRAKAYNRHMSISEFVGFSLWRHWEATNKIRRPKNT
ncbi:MAG TPA: hypothetical protein VFW94_06850 [Candidatus Acidoferrales bacterium]|nr:hypothetical protein [Candidatus Acidoferrales bacterium]